MKNKTQGFTLAEILVAIVRIEFTVAITDS